jgi:hypothetical protein
MGKPHKRDREQYSTPADAYSSEQAMRTTARARYSRRERSPSMTSIVLGREPDVFSALSLGAGALVVLDGLTFMQTFELHSFEGRRVEENISPFSLNESKTLVRQFLDGSFRHETSSPARSNW